MKLTETTRLRIEDFQKQRDWIGPLIEAYNNLLIQSIRLLNKGLLFADNIVGVSHTFSFTFETQAITFPVSVFWPYERFPPQNLTVTYASEDDTEIPVVASWKFTDDRLVQLTAVYKFTSTPAVSDLAAASKYKIRVRIEP